MTESPLDYSYRGLIQAEDILNCPPRAALRPYRRGDSGRFWSSAFKLNNNKLKSLKALPIVIDQILEVPENLTWLDLSFNHLTSITSDLTCLTNLKILYLHGNRISDFSAVLPVLRTLKSLYSLTLHGNPIEQRRGYRMRILSQLPKLKKLDFINVTHCDLEK